MSQKYLDKTGLAYLWNKIKTKITTLAVPRVASSTDNAVARFDGTIGAVQNSAVTISDTGNVTANGIYVANGSTYQFNSSGNIRCQYIGVNTSASSSYPLNVNGATYHNGNVYFANGTYYWVSNSGNARFRDIHSEGGGRFYHYARSYHTTPMSFMTASDFVQDGRDDSGTGTVYSASQTTDQGNILCQMPVKTQIYENNVLKSTSYLNTRLHFRLFGVNTSGGDVGKKNTYREDYYLPSVSNDRTAHADYAILTTKNTVSIAQGGTGATTAAAAWTALGGKSAGKQETSYFATASHTHAASDIASGTFKGNFYTSNGGYLDVYYQNGQKAARFNYLGIYTYDDTGRFNGLEGWDTLVGVRSVAKGGTGKNTLDEGYALIGNGTSAVNTRAITNITSSSTALTANTNLVTANTVKTLMNRTTSVAAADAGYTTYMARGSVLVSGNTTPNQNGQIVWQYS